MARLYADEDFPLPVVEELRRFGHDVLTVQEASRANQGIDDATVLADGTADQRAVLTHNHSDFKRLRVANEIDSLPGRDHSLLLLRGAFRDDHASLARDNGPVLGRCAAGL